MKEFRGKVALVTGGARGLGKELALTAAGLGMKLVIADINRVALDETAAELGAAGADTLAVCCDISQETQVKALADAAFDRFGTVHLLFNNAGVGCGGLVWEHSTEDWDWVLGVNLRGVVTCLRSFIPRMLEQGRADPDYRGHIVNTASMAGLVNAPLLGIYNVSKHAVVALSESLHHDLKMTGAPISSSVLCPYFVPTGIGRSEENRPAALNDGQERTPSQRASQVLIEKAVESGSVTAAQVAEITFDAVCEDRFYIFTHPESAGSVDKWAKHILSNGGPYDPYAEMPQVQSLLDHLMRESAKKSG